MKVEVVRSRRRRKTVQARRVGDILRVSVPATMSKVEEQRWVDKMVERATRRQGTEATDLAARAREVASRLGLSSPACIRWVDNQQSRWGSCTPRDGTVRISSRLAGEPLWVLDYVIVHELAHLDVPGHGQDFWELVSRYPLAERARGFLMARSLGDPGASDSDSDTGDGDGAERDGSGAGAWPGPGQGQVGEAQDDWGWATCPGGAAELTGVA